MVIDFTIRLSDIIGFGGIITTLILGAVWVKHTLIRHDVFLYDRTGAPRVITTEQCKTAQAKCSDHFSKEVTRLTKAIDRLTDRLDKVKESPND